jgi:hypothetical protein
VTRLTLVNQNGWVGEFVKAAVTPRRGVRRTRA